MNDKQLRLLNYLRVQGAMSMVGLEHFPPPGMTGDQARRAAQQLVSTGHLRVNDELRFEVIE